MIYKNTDPSQNTQSEVLQNDQFYLISKDMNESELEFVENIDTNETDVIDESLEDDDHQDSYLPSSPETALPLPKTRKRKQNLEAISPNEKKIKHTLSDTSTPNSTSDIVKNESTKSKNAKKETADNACQNKRNSYTVGIKLSVIELAEKQGNRVASRVYHMNESCVRGWRKQKDQLLKMNINKKTQRRAFPHWPELEVELKQWVNEQYEKGTKVKFQEIKNRSIVIAQKQNIENFKGTNSFIFKFMKRNDVPSASPKTRRCKVETVTSD